MLPTVPSSKLDALIERPAITMPHGGPEHRDRPGFDPLAQAPADRGQLVIQPQFRGSSGFGVEHWEAGIGDWRGRMQDDLVDALDALVKARPIDPERACIVGTRRRGCAALAGGAFHADRRRGILSNVGTPDLDTFLWTTSAHGRRSLVLDDLRRIIGVDADNRDDILEADSPSKLAKRFRAPVLLIHGEDEDGVPIAQSERMHRPLKRAGPTVRFVELEDDDHSLHRPASHLRVREETVSFVECDLAQPAH
ncbi:MAG: hypothetical protein KatS3mg121_0486 [Gammaproteobacteria bacterium]|nr:MAG: hypothetical protein KatS3mg121_0486 [Gammaproteobacteria bacterium]